MVFDLAEHERDARVDGLLALRRDGVRGGGRAADVKAAHHHVEAFGQKLPREVAGAHKLIGLHAGERDQHARARTPQLAAEPTRVDAVHSFVERQDPDRQRAERAVSHRIVRQSVEATERVARQRAAPVTDHVAVLVIAGGADQDNRQ